MSPTPHVEHRQTDGQTNRRYQMYYLPCFAVDKYCAVTGLQVLGHGKYGALFLPIQTHAMNLRGYQRFYG